MSNSVLIEQLDDSIDLLLTDPDVAIANVDASVAELLGIAAELRTLPRPDFRSQLRVSLMEDVLASSTMGGAEVMAATVIRSGSFPRERTLPVKEKILPTLFMPETGHAARRSNFAISLLAHAAALALILTSSLWVHQRYERSSQVMTIEQRPVSEYLALDNAANSAGGGGGGGDHDKAMASQGHLPKSALDQLTPPEVVIRNEHPKMTAEATVIVPPQVNLQIGRASCRERV